MNEQRKTHSTDIDRIAEELVCWAGSGAMIIDHMARWPTPASSGDNAAEALLRLVRETLAPIVDRHAAADLATAADVLAGAVETLQSEILLVDPSVLEDGP